MKIGDIISALRKRQEAMQADIFQKPPQDMMDFAKRQGVWMGLNDALGVIEDARKRELSESD